MIPSDLIFFLCAVFIVVVMTLLICLDAICVSICVCFIMYSTHFVLCKSFVNTFKALAVLANCLLVLCFFIKFCTVNQIGYSR